MSNNNDLFLELINVCKSFKEYSGNETNIFQGVNLKIFLGEKIAIIGESGAGKTTLLNIACLLEKNYQGTVLLKGKKIDSQNESLLAELRLKNFGFVYQDHYLLTEFTCCENVAIPLLIKGYKRSDAQNQSLEMLKKLDLVKKAENFPGEISGGEKQKLAIARAFIAKPKVVFADEPTGSLDFKNSQKIEKFFLEILSQNTSSFVMVTHNIDLAYKMDKVYLLENMVLKQVK